MEINSEKNNFVKPGLLYLLFLTLPVKAEKPREALAGRGLKIMINNLEDYTYIRDISIYILNHNKSIKEGRGINEFIMLKNFLY